MIVTAAFLATGEELDDKHKSIQKPAPVFKDGQSFKV